MTNFKVYDSKTGKWHDEAETKAHTYDGLLVETLKEYESDTFSASASHLSQREAEIIAGELVKDFIDARLDGVKIAVKLDEMREAGISPPRWSS